MIKAVSSFVFSTMSTLKNNSISAFNIIIAIGTFGTEKLLSTAVFKCPCSEYNATVTDNYLYGMIFIFVPSSVLFVIGYAMNPLTWRLFTGCCKRKSKSRKAKTICVAALQIMFRALVAPISWICISFLDGKYYACAMSTNPYIETCDKVYKDGTAFSIEYHNYVAKSQVFGWIITGSSFVVGALLFSILRCSSDHTHWHRQYLMWTKEIESELYETGAKEKIKNDATENIELFLKNCQTKKDWDDVTTLCEDLEAVKTGLSPVREGEEAENIPLHDLNKGKEAIKMSYSSLQDWAKRIKHETRF